MAESADAVFGGMKTCRLWALQAEFKNKGAQVSRGRGKMFGMLRNQSKNYLYNVRSDLSIMCKAHI